MLQIAVALLYITLLCWTYGYITIALFKNITAAQQTRLPGFSIVCMTGLSCIAVLAGILSIFVPLGGILVQLSLLLAGAVYWVVNKNIRADFMDAMKQGEKTYNLPTLLLLITFLFLLIVMSAWTIIHPDTLGYHAQTIRWIESYKAIPGLVHMHVRYGLQSNWYLLCALFGFSFTHTTALTFINTSVACWFVLFATCRLSKAIRQKNDSDLKGLVTGILFFLLLVMSILDFGQLRLTAVSASPDFTAAIYLWLVFFLLVNKSYKENEVVYLMLTFFFSIVAITIKLSSAPILLVSCFALYRLLVLRRKSAIAFMVVLGLLVIIPFVTRNLITSGYAVFPLTFPDIVQFDWKLDKIRTAQVKQYITAYARIGPLAAMGKQQPDIVNRWSGWLPVWWSNRSVAEKTMLASLSVLLLLGCVYVRKIIHQSSVELRTMLCVSVTGILFWFIQAPDPRFGYGFILPVQGVLLYRLAAGYSFNYKAGKRLLMSGVFTLIILAAGYTAYRFYHFFYARNLIVPEGISTIACKKTPYNGIIFYIPYDDCECGGTPLPCAYYTEPFLMRGKKLTDGFKSVKQPDK